MTANKKHRRRSRRTSVGWAQRQSRAQLVSRKAVDESFVQAFRDAYAAGGYVYRTRGGPWMVGFHRRPPRTVPEGRLL